MPDKGIFKKIFQKNAKPVNAHRVVISDTQKRSVSAEEKDALLSFEAIDFNNIYEEAGLEETPIADAVAERPQRNENTDANRRSKETRTDTVLAGVNGYRSQKRHKSNKKSFLSSFGSIASFIKNEPKTSNSSALEFAENTKRLSKKSRRNRRILIYSGTGLLVIAIMLFVVLVPGGAAAPAGASKTPDISKSLTTPAFVASQSESPIDTAEESDYFAEESDYFAEESDYFAEESDYLTEESDFNEIPEDSTIPTTEVSEVAEPTAIETTAPDITPPPVNIDDVVQSFKVEADLYYNEVGYSSNHYEYTDEELYILAQVIHREARGESTKGKIAVGNVVMNRVLCRGFPGNTIKQVVTRANQFAYSPGTKPSPASKIAARQVLEREVWVIPQNIYYFKVSSSKSNWGSHKYEFNIGAHAFYSHSYSGRFRGDTVPPALYKRTFKWPTRGCKPEHRVYRLQWMLNKLGYKVKADKWFGEDTREAIKDFQKKKGMKVDGVAGPATLKALILEFGLRQYYLKFGDKN